MTGTEKWVAFQTIAAKEIQRFLRIWVQTLIPPVITMSLYFIIFGNLIGKQIGDIKGFSYMEFIVPGLILMAVISNSYANVVSSFYGAKFQRHIEEMMVSPVPVWIILAGYIIGGVARGLLVGAIVTVVALFFTDLHIAHPLLAIVIVLLTAVLFSIAGLINALFANSFDDISIIPTFVLTPLTYLGGVFYSIQMLPDFWQTVSRANPILYMIDGFRWGVLGASDMNPWISVSMIFGFVGVLGAIALAMLKKGFGIRT